MNDGVIDMDTSHNSKAAADQNPSGAKAIILRVSLGLFARLPLALNHLLGRAIGLGLFWLPTKPAKITRINLTLCFPERDNRWRNRITRQSLMASGMLLTEAAYLWRSDEHRIQSLIKSINGQEVLDAALSKNRGVVFITPHLGCWEVTSLYMATKLPLTCLYRPSRVSSLDSHIRRSRQGTGARLTPATASGLKVLFKALKHGECIGVLPDQVPRYGTGTLAPFFSVPAYSMVLVSRLAVKNRIPVILIWAKRLPAGKGYTLDMHALPEEFYSEDISASTSVLNQCIETLARQHPGQYTWSYKRFRKMLPEQTEHYRQ